MLPDSINSASGNIFLVGESVNISRLDCYILYPKVLVPITLLTQCIIAEYRPKRATLYGEGKKTNRENKE